MTGWRYTTDSLIRLFFFCTPFSYLFFFSLSLFSDISFIMVTDRRQTDSDRISGIAELRNRKRDGPELDSDRNTHMLFLALCLWTWTFEAIWSNLKTLTPNQKIEICVSCSCISHANGDLWDGILWVQQTTWIMIKLFGYIAVDSILLFAIYHIFRMSCKECSQAKFIANFTGKVEFRRATNAQGAKQSVHFIGPLSFWRNGECSHLNTNWWTEISRYAKLQSLRDWCAYHCLYWIWWKAFNKSVGRNMKCTVTWLLICLRTRNTIPCIVRIYKKKKKVKKNILSTNKWMGLEEKLMWSGR